MPFLLSLKDFYLRSNGIVKLFILESFEVNPSQIRLSKGQNTLEAATMRGFAAIVQELLNNGEDVDVRIGDDRSALFNIMKMFSHNVWRSKNWENFQAHLNTIQILLQHGASIFEIDNIPRSLLHWAAVSYEPVLSSLIIEQAKQLEESGLIGSVQRLLRARNNRGQTPIDWASIRHKKHLQGELDAAVLRDGGKIMCNSGTSDIVQISNEHLNQESLMEYFKFSDIFLDFTPYYARYDVGAMFTRYISYFPMIFHKLRT